MDVVPHSMTRDLAYALRMIASHRWFSAAVVVTLALGIGLNTMVFTLVNAVLLRPLAIPGGERLVAINSQQRSNPENRYSVSSPTSSTTALPPPPLKPSKPPPRKKAS